MFFHGGVFWGGIGAWFWGCVRDVMVLVWGVWGWCFWCLGMGWVLVGFGIWI